MAICLDKKSTCLIKTNAHLPKKVIQKIKKLKIEN